jgi:uncharacterized protein YndB with AHSA1/START domain
MKSKKLVIKINKPVAEVFEFVTNPANTPKWLEFIVVEKTNEMPPKLGTIYKNRNKAREWSTYEMTTFQQNKMFIMSNRHGNYDVQYIFKPLGDNETQLEYYEWVNKGELEKPFTQDILEKLKLVIETGNT